MCWDAEGVGEGEEHPAAVAASLLQARWGFLPFSGEGLAMKPI